MNWRPAILCWLFWFAPLARAQVLDDDLEFENHVCSIELGEDSTILDGVGLSREIGYEASFEGTLYLSVMAEQRVDPLVRLETIDGERVAEDDDSGGGKHAHLQHEVRGGEAFLIRVAVKGRAPARLRFKLFEAEETDATRAAAKEGQVALAEAIRLRKAGQLDDARKRLHDAVEKLLAIEGLASSRMISGVLRDIGSEVTQPAQRATSRGAVVSRTIRKGWIPQLHGAHWMD